MKTLFKSQELWDIVETGYTEPDPAPATPTQQLKENRKKDAKALLFIQSALDDEIFPRIMSAANAQEAWEILKQEYLGDQRVIKVRLQTLRRELMMGDKESIQAYLGRVIAIVGQTKSYGEKISNETVVGKVLRSLNPNWDHIVPAIEESKDLTSYTFDELMGTLLAHEGRVKKNEAKVEEKAFQVKGESSNKGSTENSAGRGHGRGGFRGRGRGGRGRFNE
uniref:UBN2 domain-containing protein n=1 Tax=Chenopodium quinoa TaxID=63459 RepID=A0A803LNQ1_CHEQI